MARHLKITGLVQGVGYRASFERQARELGLCGWVRNRRNGSVEALVRGAPQAVEALIAWARRGPSQAHVSGIEVRDADDALVPETAFEVRPTA